MNGQKPGMFTPALIGGCIAGVLSGIPIVNCLCCLWMIGGGLVAAYLLVRDSTVVLTAGYGAIVGVFSGIVASVVEYIVSIPMASVTNKIYQNLMEKVAEFSGEMPEGWEAWFERGTGETSAFWSLLGFVMAVCIFSALGALGGLIGISFFGKKKFQKKQEVIDVPKETDDS